MNTKVDFNFLEKQYNIIKEELPAAVLFTSLSDLLNEEKAGLLIQSVMQIIRANKPNIAAYHMSSWLGMICSAVQASISLYDTVLLLSPERIWLHIVRSGGKRKVTFLIRDWENVCVSVDQDVEARAQALNHFYEKTVSPILRGMAQATGTREHQLWSQFVTRLYNERDFCINIVPSEDTKRRIHDDFVILTNQLNLEKLELARNPFKVEFPWIEQLQNSRELTRLKVACCLAYQTDTSHGYCYTCPRLSEEGRKQKRELYAQG